MKSFLDEEVHVATTKELVEDAIHGVDQQCLDCQQDNSAQLSSNKQPATKEGSDPEEQGGSSDSGYSQQSEPESSDNNDDSAKLSQTPLEEQTTCKTSENIMSAINSSSLLKQNLEGKLFFH